MYMFKPQRPDGSVLHPSQLVPVPSITKQLELGGVRIEEDFEGDSWMAIDLITGEVRQREQSFSKLYAWVEERGRTLGGDLT